MKYLAIMQCPRHNFFAVAIEEENGCGARLTHGKCCGSWTTVRRWSFDNISPGAFLEALDEHEILHGETEDVGPVQTSH